MNGCKWSCSLMTIKSRRYTAIEPPTHAGKGFYEAPIPWNLKTEQCGNNNKGGEEENKTDRDLVPFIRIGVRGRWWWWYSGACGTSVRSAVLELEGRPTHTCSRRHSLASRFWCGKLPLQANSSGGGRAPAEALRYITIWAWERIFMRHYSHYTTQHAPARQAGREPRPIIIVLLLLIMCLSFLREISFGRRRAAALWLLDGSVVLWAGWR